MKNKRSLEQRAEMKQKIKKIEKIIIKYALIFVFTMALLMILPKYEKYIIYIASILSSASVLLVIKNKYISVKRLGLGKTRKELEKEINIIYLKSVLISICVIAGLVLIDFLAYHLTVDIKLVIYLYLFGLNIFTLPLNYLLNIRQSIAFRLLTIILAIVIIGSSYWLYFIKNYYYISFIVLITAAVILFVFRQRGYYKKDL